MMNGEALYALQQIDSTLDQLVHRRTRLPELVERAAAAAAVAALRQAGASADQRAAAAQAAIEASEHDAAALTAKRTRLEAQLKTVIAPREAEALMHEIATINGQRGELDDRELQALDEQAEGEHQSAEVTGRLPEAEAQLEEADRVLAMATASLDAEHDEQVAARERIVSEISADDLHAYDRARRQFAGVAIAHLDGMRCTGCHLDISRAEVDAIRRLPATELGECPQCGRFLVR
jgi:predicted  nucleic acid-binding Zn-ribbon protein